MSGLQAWKGLIIGSILCASIIFICWLLYSSPNPAQVAVDMINNTHAKQVIIPEEQTISYWIDGEKLCFRLSEIPERYR